MDSNPYSSPATNENDSVGAVSDFVRHRVFSHSWSFLGITTEGSRETLRLRAEEFINTTLGAEAVISIVELNSPSQVVVWYREI